MPYYINITVSAAVSFLVTNIDSIVMVMVPLDVV
jgi:hypothetical protein